MSESTDRLQWEMTLAKSALENWGRHHPWCALSSDPNWVCSCGLADAIARAARAAVPGDTPK